MINYRKRCFVIASVAACALFAACVAPSSFIVRRAAFPVPGEKVFLHPAIDSSSLDSFPGWPPEGALRAPLASALRKLDSNLTVEFRRCEKYGQYELTDDSLSAGVGVRFVIGHYRNIKDTLELPVSMLVRQKTMNKSFSLSMTGRGVYKAKTAAKSPYHYIDILVADFCRNFAYSQAAEVFYRPPKAGGPVQPKKRAP